MSNHSLNEFCNCGYRHRSCDCFLEDHFDSRFRNDDFDYFRRDDFRRKRSSSCFRQPFRELSPLKSLDDRFDRRRRHDQEDRRCFHNDDIRIRDDGKSIIINISKF